MTKTTTQSNNEGVARKDGNDEDKMSALPRVVTPERRNSQRRRAATTTAATAAASPPPIADIEKMIRDGTLDDILPLVEEAYAAKMAKRGILNDVSLMTVPVIARKGDTVWVQETKEKETECILAENWYKGDLTVSFMWECYQGRGPTLVYDVDKVWLPVNEKRGRGSKRKCAQKAH